MNQRIEHLELENGVSAPRAGRQFVARVLTTWFGAGPAIEQFQLLVSELVSNAVLHGSGSIQITISEHDAAPGVARIEVRNEGEGTPVLRHAHREELSGRGLYLIDELSVRWGTQAVDGHTMVWFEGDARQH